MISFGLEIMKDEFTPVRELPDFVALFQLFEATDYLGVLKSALVGCVATLVVQSSSATLGMTIALANTGVVDFRTVAAVVLGTNIGTTITAYLASVGADDINAKRTAYFLVFFNVSGVIVVTALFLPVYMPFIETVAMDGIDPNVQDPGGNFPYMTAGLATVHTVFNLVTALAFIPFVTHIGNALNRLVTDQPKHARAHVTRLAFRLGSPPLTAIEQSRHEIRRTDQHVRDMLNNLRLVITDETTTEDVVQKVFTQESTIDEVQIEVTKFLTDLLSEELSHGVAEEARTQLRLADELESLSDDVSAVLKLYLRMREAGVRFTGPQQEELVGLHDLIADYYDSVRSGLEHAPEDYSPEILQESFNITGAVRDLRNRHWNRLSEETVAPLVSTSYLDIANSYRRMKDHLLNIGEAAVGGKTLGAERQGTATPR